MALSEQQADEIGDLIPSMRGFARGLTGRHDAADDLVQDALAKAISKIDRFEEGTNMKAWLFRIMRNAHIDEMRKVQRRGVHLDVDDSEAVQLGAPGSQFSAVELTEFRLAFAKLSETDREVLLLIGMEGHTYEEVSGMIDLPVGTVKSRLSRARARLRQVMDAPATQTRANHPKSRDAGSALITAGGHA